MPELQARVNKASANQQADICHVTGNNDLASLKNPGENCNVQRLDSHEQNRAFLIKFYE